MARRLRLLRVFFADVFVEVILRVEMRAALSAIEAVVVGHVHILPVGAGAVARWGECAAARDRERSTARA